MADQWVGYGLMLKLIPRSEKMFEGITHEYYFRFLNYCKYKKAWMVKAKKKHEENVKELLESEYVYSVLNYNVPIDTKQNPKNGKINITSHKISNSISL